MIQANELRIGNKFFVDNNELSIWGIDMDYADEGFPLFSAGGLQFEDFRSHKVEPIPLTEEWLFRFGLMDKPHDKAFHIGSMEFDIPSMIGGCHDNETGLDQENSIHIQSVHQLQNLYFALTGEELKLKDK